MTAIDVVIATCNRPDELSECLRSIAEQTLPARLIVVVDDAPGGARTPAVVERWAAHVPLRYVAGRRAGLAAAHNRGLREVGAELVAFTDDDVVAEPDWLQRIVDAFVAVPGAGCVTGLIRPLELATREQRWLEGYARFGKGAQRRVVDLRDNRPPDPLFPFTAGSLGSGANMAFASAALRGMGGFDPALGAGTLARGGDDLAAFFEVLQHGHALVYEPAAVVNHRHRSGYDALRRQVYGYGIGLTAYLTKSFLDRPRLLASALRRLPRAAAHAVGPRSARNAGRAPDFPAELVRLELLGMLVGPVAYAASRRRSRRLSRSAA